MSQISKDIAFVRSIIPDHYTVKECSKPKEKGSIHCISPTGFQKPNKDTDQGAFDVFHRRLKDHFGKRFQETFCITCTCYVNFIIYLKPNP